MTSENVSKSCPRCGSTAPRALRPPSTVCLNVKQCERRARVSRVAEDKKRGGPQCPSTTGSTSILFCDLRAGHTGPHCHGKREWTENTLHPLGAFVLGAMDPERLRIAKSSEEFLEKVRKSEAELDRSKARQSDIDKGILR